MRIYYSGTSFLVRFILPGSYSEPTAGLFQGLPVDQPAISHWTRVEFASLVA